MQWKPMSRQLKFSVYVIKIPLMYQQYAFLANYKHYQ